MLNYTRKEQKEAAKNELNGKWGVSIGAMLMAIFVPVNVAVLPFSFACFAPISALATESYIFALISGILSIAFLYLPFLLLFVGPLMIGYYAFNLRLGRGLDVRFSTPYRCFTSGVWGRYAKGYFMYNLFIFLWSCLLIVPGIIKSFSYGMMFYIMADHPEMGWREAMKESARMMHGHKWDFFVLGLSFFGWLLLAYCTYSLSMLYSGPYMYQTFANFYRDLKGETLNVPRPVPSYDMPH